MLPTTSSWDTLAATSRCQGITATASVSTGQLCLRSGQMAICAPHAANLDDAMHAAATQMAATAKASVGCCTCSMADMQYDSFQTTCSRINPS